MSTFATKHPETKLCRKAKCPHLGEPGVMVKRPDGSEFQTRYALCKLTGRIPGNIHICPEDRIPLHELRYC
jgi:hypothetical protein